MIAAISSVLPAASATRSPSRRPSGTSSRTGWAFQPMPNLSREVRQKIGKAKAGWTFTTICTELGYACHKGKATWDQQRLGIGLRALARESGQDVRKVRRDVKALAGIGLVVISRPKVLHVADPATGRIVTKAKGRCEATIVYLTITEAVLRPSKGQNGTMGGTTMEPPAAACKGHHGTTVREEQNQRTPDGDAVGIGTPPATGGRLTPAEAPGLTAGEAGGHSAAKASSERVPVLPVDAGRDEPQLPAGRILPTPGAAKAATPGGRRRHSEGDEPQSAAEYAEAWKRSLRDPERERRLSEYLKAKERREQGAKADAPQPPDRPAEAAVVEQNRDAWRSALAAEAGKAVA